MYVDFYRLKRTPFTTRPTGSDVFIGPQTARIMQSLRNALAHDDAVVAVTGDAGLGKTTLVHRALEALDERYSVVRIPRMQLAHDDVLDYLLEQLGADQVPASTIRKVLLCRRLLAERTQKHNAACIVVEDASRLGADALIELEALTAADGQDTPGARMVLLGDSSLGQALQGNSDLSRLNLRLRLRFPLQPLDQGELLAYLKHNFRIAGNEFDALFGDGCAEALHALSGGNPRLANNLVDSVLTTGAEQKLERLDPALLAAVALEEYDLHYSVPPGSPSADVPDAVDLADGPESAANEDHGTAPLTDDDYEDEDVDPAESNTITAENLVLDEDELPQQAAQDDSDLPGATSVADDECVAETVNRGDEEPEAEPAAVENTITERVIHGNLQAATGTPPVEEPVVNDVLPDLSDLAPELAELSGIGALEDEAPPQQAVSTMTGEPAAVDDDEVPTLFSSMRMESPGAAAVTTAAELPASGVDVDDANAESDTDNAASDSGEDVLAPDFAAASIAAAAEDDSGEDHPAEPPAWERDPTLAELRPDIEALEAALSDFGSDDESRARPDEEPDPEIELKDPTIMGVPEITLDMAIQEKIAEATQALEKHDATIAEEEVDDAPVAVAEAPRVLTPDIVTPPPRPEPVAIEEPTPDPVAEGIARARSLEDVDDRMAETLFGEEFASIAAAAVASGTMPSDAEPPAESDIEELSLVADAVIADKDAESTDDSAVAPVVAEATPSAMEQEFREVYGQNAVEVSLQSDKPKGGLDLSASQRLATVRALNADKNLSAARSTVNGSNGAAVAAPASGAPPQSIEDQMESSMTQTLKALSMRRNSANDDDDDDDDNEGRTGFFSRFKRS